MRRAALRSALSAKASEEGIVVVENMVLAEPKTRLMAQALNRLVGESSALILVPEKNQEFEMVIRSTNNIPDAKTLMAGYLNIRDLMTFDKVILPVQSLDVIAANLG
jgi:large subunit ribosomal protein L4